MDKIMALPGSDKNGNTPLHYAVAEQRVLTIGAALARPDTRVNAKNHYGESAADWFREYASSACDLVDHDELGNLASSIALGYAGDVAYLLAHGMSRKLRCLVDNVIQPPLHLATRYHQLDIVKLLLRDINRSLVAELLAIQDSYGQTPLMLAQAEAQRCSTQTAAHDVLSYIMDIKEKCDTSKAASADLLDQSVTLPTVITLPKNYQQCIFMLNQRLLKGVSEHDFSALCPALPTLCTLAYLTCRQALSLLQDLPASTHPRQREAEELLQRLFGTTYDYTMAMINQLQQKMGAIVNYLNSTIQQGQVSQLLELSTKYDTTGMSMLHEHKIYLNLTIKTNLLDLVKTVIHEASHMATMSHDFVYSTPYLKYRKAYFSNFCSYAQLAKTGIDSNIPPHKKDLLHLQYRMECSDGVQWPETLGQWKALNNADTLASAAMGLAAIDSGHATLNFRRQTFAISEEFLSCSHVETLQRRYNLDRHAAKDASPRTPESTLVTPTKVENLDDSGISTSTGPGSDRGSDGADPLKSGGSPPSSPELTPVSPNLLAQTLAATEEGVPSSAKAAFSVKLAGTDRQASLVSQLFPDQ